jgi:UDP-2-acetamido-3-amino-2,3-dideoxy-glucuronate N-acetyltransferase
MMLGVLGSRLARSSTIIGTSGRSIRKRAVRGVEVYDLPAFHEHRGDLSVAEFKQDLPFEPQRYFLVHNVPEQEVRGQHAHRICQQFLICVGGSVTVLVDDGHRREEIRLQSPDRGLYVPARIWASQRGFSKGGALLVFASHPYEPQDYIRSYEQFLAECRAPVPTAA